MRSIFARILGKRYHEAKKHAEPPAEQLEVRKRLHDAADELNYLLGNEAMLFAQQEQRRREQEEHDKHEREKGRNIQQPEPNGEIHGHGR